MMAYMEKNRLYIMRDSAKEEPVLSGAYLCEFSDLEIKAVLLDEIMRMPDTIKNIKEFIENFETQSLREAKAKLDQVSIKEATEFIEKNPHPRLWKLLAEKALDKQDLLTAEKAFIKCEDLYGVRFVKKIQIVDEANKKKAEVAAFYEKYDDAEQIYTALGRTDLALELRKKIGDYKKVIQLLGQGTSSDIEIKEANKKMGDYYAEKGKWAKAAGYYQVAQNYTLLIEAYYKAEDYEGLKKTISTVPEDPSLMEDLATKFNSVGMCEAAVEAYIRVGEVKKAIDSCILLNDWNRVLFTLFGPEVTQNRLSSWLRSITSSKSKVSLRDMLHNYWKRRR
jgi:WD repeat-containing protein 35